VALDCSATPSHFARIHGELDLITDKEFEGVDITQSEGPDIEAAEWSDDSTPQGKPDAARLHEEDQMRSVRAFEGDREEGDREAGGREEGATNE
jgi:hypothetical protein